MTWEVLCKCSGKYIDICFNLKITCLLRGVPMVAEGVIYFVCVQWHVSNIRLFHSLLLLILLPPPPWALRQPHCSQLC